jgi:hypothetical protein
LEIQTGCREKNLADYGVAFGAVPELPNATRSARYFNVKQQEL